VRSTPSVSRSAINSVRMDEGDMISVATATRVRCFPESSICELCISSTMNWVAILNRRGQTTVHRERVN
jgi:hypothetical protein